MDESVEMQTDYQSFGDARPAPRARLAACAGAVFVLGTVFALLQPQLKQPRPASATPEVSTAAEPQRVATVVLTFFEPELDPWRRLEATETLPFFTPEPLHYLPSLHALVLCTGMGPRQASAAVTALGFDPRFDLSKAVWLISGVAGIDPGVGSVGSVAIASRIVDMSVAYYVDRAEQDFPPEWSTGWLPLTCTEPFCRAQGSHTEARAGQIAFELSAPLVAWAAELASAVVLPDAECLRRTRAPFGAAGFASAARPPAVVQGDTLSGGTVWVGFAALAWARAWVGTQPVETALFVVRDHSLSGYWGGEMLTSAMEDSAVAVALRLLHRAGRANSSRLLSLRAAANYCTQPPDVSIGAFVAGFGAADRRAREGASNDSIYWDPGRDPVSRAAAANAHRVAAVLVRALATGGHEWSPP